MPFRDVPCQPGTGGASHRLLCLDALMCLCHGASPRQARMGSMQEWLARSPIPLALTAFVFLQRPFLLPSTLAPHRSSPVPRILVIACILPAVQTYRPDLFAPYHSSLVICHTHPSSRDIRLVPFLPTRHTANMPALPSPARLFTHGNTPLSKPSLPFPTRILSLSLPPYPNYVSPHDGHARDCACRPSILAHPLLRLMASSQATHISLFVPRYQAQI